MAKKIRNDVHVQFAGKEISATAVTDKIKERWTAGGGLIKEIDSIDAYVKPEEGMVYYVINRDSEAEEVTGSILISEIAASDEEEGGE